MTAVSQARAEHARWHRCYREHLEHCVRACLVGGQCERAREILANADAAGERWRLASERASRALVAASRRAG